MLGRKSDDALAEFAADIIDSMKSNLLIPIAWGFLSTSWPNW